MTDRAAPPSTTPRSLPSLPTSPPVIGAGGRRILLELARAAVAAAIDGLPAPDVDDRTFPAELRAPASAFVTIREDGQLRGCMGRLDPGRAAWENVVDAAGTAAIGDPRFRPVGEDERAALELEVSVLGPFVDLPDPASFVPGLHGIVAERGLRRALLLPQVATENGWDGRAMLDAVCWKAGLARDAWRDPSTRLAVFTAAVFGDKG